MGIPKKYFLFAFVLVTAYAIVLNELDLSAIRKKNPSNTFWSNRCLTYNYTITSIDNAWYVNQVKNFLNGKGFTIDPHRYNYNVRRTPVYPLFYGLHYIAFGEKGSYFFIRYTQVLLFAFSAIALFVAAFNFTNNKTIALFSAVLYAFNPTLVSFLYYTITEALSPALVCFLLYFLSLCKKYNRKKDWLMAGIFFAVASLCRPLIFFMGFPIFFLALYTNRRRFKSMAINSIFFALGGGLLFVPYIIRNYIVTNGEIIVLEKYYGDPMNYGMPNMQLRKWISCWMNPADYSSEDISNHMKISICCSVNETKETVLADEMKKIPARGYIVNNKEDIRSAYSSLYDYYLSIMHQYPQQLTDSIEQVCMTKIRKLKSDYIKQAPLQYYVVTPLLLVKSVVLQSNAASIAVLDNYHGNYFKIVLKLMLYLLNIWLFYSLFALVVWWKKYLEIYAMTMLFAVSSMLYITFVIKYCEARYLLPMFPLFFITGSIVFVEIIAGIKRKLHF